MRFHDLRHTYASLLIKNGEHPKYIQKQLGHKSIKTTMDVYGHLMEGTNTESADKIAGLALGIKEDKLKGGSKKVGNEENSEKENSKTSLSPRKQWCRETESNRRHKAFQASALPTELSRHGLLR